MKQGEQKVLPGASSLVLRPAAPAGAPAGPAVAGAEAPENEGHLRGGAEPAEDLQLEGGGLAEDHLVRLLGHLRADGAVLGAAQDESGLDLKKNN